MHMLMRFLTWTDLKLIEVMCTIIGLVVRMLSQLNGKKDQLSKTSSTNACKIKRQAKHAALLSWLKSEFCVGIYIYIACVAFLHVFVAFLHVSAVIAQPVLPDVTV